MPTGHVSADVAIVLPMEAPAVKSWPANVTTTKRKCICGAGNLTPYGCVAVDNREMIQSLFMCVR